MGLIVALIVCDIVVSIIVAGDGIPIAILGGVPVDHGLGNQQIRRILIHQRLKGLYHAVVL